MRLRLSPLVKQDLAEIAEYIARDNHRNAANWIRELRSHFAKIAKHPLLYQLRPEIGNDARVVPVGLYVILFRVRGETVRIERVVHGRRDLLGLLEQAER